jgi:hypothetical protein
VGKAVASAPHHGETPIPISTTTGVGSARFDWEIPADVFSDASAAVVSAGPAFKDALDKR